MFFSPSRFFRFAPLALLLCVFAAGAGAQESSDDDSDWYWGKNISSVTFEGLSSVKKSELKGITSAFVGKPLDDDNYTKLVDRLYALDLFEDISSYVKHSPKSDKDVLLVLKMVERPVITSIDFSGNKKIRNGELRETVTIKTGDVYIESKALLDERALRDAYLKKGFTGAKVSHRAEQTEKGMKVVFTIDEGASTVIKTIRFSGNKVVSERTLKRKLSLKEVGLARDGAFQRSALEVDKQTVVSYYADRGYADARVIDVMQEESYNEEKARNELTLTFLIQEGAQYTYGGTVITGNVIFSEEKLLSRIKLKVGDTFNQTKYQEGMQGITAVYAENGYMTNQYTPDVIKDADRNVISFTLAIVENSRSHIENIIIKGNTRTKEYVITREIPLESGDVFSRDKVMTGLRNLYNTQYFSSVVPEPVMGSEPDLVNLVINVEEQSTKSLEFGLTFSGVSDPDEFPISLFAKIQDSNFLGTGRTIGANTTISNKDLSLGLSYSQNWTGGQPISLSENLSFNYSTMNAYRLSILPDGTVNDDDYYMQYKNFAISLAQAVGRRWFPSFAILTWNAGLTTTLRMNKYDQGAFVPLDTGVSQSADSLRLSDTIWTSVSLDNRDINYDPSKGWFANERISWCGIIPGLEQEFFFRTDTKLEAYCTLFNIPVTEKWAFKWVLAAYTGLSLIFPLPDSPLGDSNKLYIDGMFNGRGWTDVYNKTRGKAMLSARAELRMPLMPGIIGVDCFFDMVTTKPSARDMFKGLSAQDLYFSFGPGIRFLLPQFPLHLLFANCFKIGSDNKVEWEDTWKFVLSFNMVNR